MKYLTSKEMTNPPNHWYIDILIWIKDNAIIWTSFLLGWKGLDLGFKFLKDGRDTAIRSIVQDEINKSMAGKLDNLSDKVDKLGNAVFELRSRL